MSPHQSPDNLIRILHCSALSPDGVYADHSIYGIVNPAEPQSVTPLPSYSLRVLENEQEKFNLIIGDESCTPLAPEIFDSRVVSPVLEKDGVRVRVIDLLSKDVTAQLFLASATQVSTRLTKNTLTIADNLGRVIAVDLRRNCSIRSFRI